jgi:hypothetical protein
MQVACANKRTADLTSWSRLSYNNSVTAWLRYALHLESYMDEMGDIIIGYQRGELYH